MMDFITTSAQNLAPSATFVARKRVALFGDSQAFRILYPADMTTAANQFVVANGIATLKQSNNSFAPGNYVSLQTLGDPNFTLALNGACTPILTRPDSNTITVSATYGGVTMADGDYSNPLSSGQGWTLSSPSRKVGDSLLHYMRALANDPFDLTANYSKQGQFTTALPYQIAKSVYGPAFDVAYISTGTNDLFSNGANASTATAIAYKVFYILQQSVATLQAAGKQVMIQFPSPYSVTSNASMKPQSAGMALLRRMLFNWAGRNNVFLIDTYAAMIDGQTSPDGISFAAWVTDTIHLNQIGQYNLAKLPFINNVFNNNPYINDVEPVSPAEDTQVYSQSPTAWSGGATYAVGDTVRNGQNMYYCKVGGQSAASGGPTGTGSSITDNTVTWAYVSTNTVNLVKGGIFYNTGGSNNTSAAFTGTVPQYWTLTRGGLATGTTAVQTRTAITGTRSAYWGKEWAISATFTASGEYVGMSQDFFSQMVAGYWYQFGITLTAQNSWGTNVQKIQATINFGGWNAHAMYDPIGSTTIPLVANDVLTLRSEPFFYDGTLSNQANFALNVYANAAGTVNYAASSAWCRVVPNPTI